MTEFGLKNENVTGENAVGNTASANVVKCKSCGADMLFDIKLQKLVCPYCGCADGVQANAFEIEHTLDGFDESSLKKETGAVAYVCPNCHAETVMRDFKSAARCPFCGATNILSVDDLPGLAPDAILPFKITKDEAAKNSREWIRKKWFAPSKLKKTFTPKNMNALYVPTFTYDSSTSSIYKGRLGKSYTVTVGTGKNRRTETRVRWFDVEGGYDRSFDDVLIEASPTLEQNQFDKVGGFDTQNAVEYSKEYIAGMLSERHNISVNDGFESAKVKMSDRIRCDILSQYDYDREDYLDVRTEYKNNSFKHLLLPLWCCAFKFKEKLYKYLVNGRTGRVGGKTPVSPLKVGLTFVVVVAVFGALLWYFMNH